MTFLLPFVICLSSAELRKKAKATDGGDHIWEFIKKSLHSHTVVDFFDRIKYLVMDEKGRCFDSSF